jgi:glycerol uptake facilitator-like aquaporin
LLVADQVGLRTAPALIVGGWALAQLWLFWVAPLIGAGLAGVAYRLLGSEMTQGRRDGLRGANT